MFNKALYEGARGRIGGKCVYRGKGISRPVRPARPLFKKINGLAGAGLLSGAVRSVRGEAWRPISDFSGAGYACSAWLGRPVGYVAESKEGSGKASLRGRKLGLDSLDAGNADADLAGGLTDTRPGLQRGPDGLLVPWGCTRPPKPLALRSGARDPGLDAIADHGALEFGEDAII